jgi:hypothetical protein
MAEELGLTEPYWDDWNREHILKHQVTEATVHEVVFSDALVRPSYKGRFKVIGSDALGRTYCIVVGSVPHRPAVYYVFSARPASRG